MTTTCAHLEHNALYWSINVLRIIDAESRVTHSDNRVLRYDLGGRRTCLIKLFIHCIKFRLSVFKNVVTPGRRCVTLCRPGILQVKFIT
jgi:hypothetical protein